jgi:hypothetical protein
MLTQRVYIQTPSITLADFGRSLRELEHKSSVDDRPVETVVPIGFRY